MLEWFQQKHSGVILLFAAIGTSTLLCNAVAHQVLVLRSCVCLLHTGCNPWEAAAAMPHDGRRLCWCVT